MIIDDHCIECRIVAKRMASRWTYEEASRELDKIIEDNEFKKTQSKSSSFFDPEVTCSICGHVGQSRHHHLDHSINKTPLKKVDLENHRKFSSDDSFISSTREYSSRNFVTSRTPDSILLLEAKHSANSVIMAFRDLQSKAKVIEKERASAIRVREELRQELAESKRGQELARNKQELRANDHYLSLKSSTEELMVGHSRLQSSINDKANQLSRIQHQLLNQQAKQSLLESDRKKYKVETTTVNEKLSTIRSELINSTHRVETLEKRFPGDHSKEINSLSRQMEALVENIERDHIAHIRADTRLAAMEKYLDIILKVNGDLCDALTSQTETENRLAKMVQKQLTIDSKMREKEIQLILESAESIGLTHALEISRQMQQLVGPRMARSVSPPRRSHPNKDAGPKRHDTNRKSISPGRYDKSVIEAAARMAATAAATSLVTSQQSATHCTACPPKKKFIPTGARANKEFNIVATVSNAAREAKNLNAKVASRFPHQIFPSHFNCLCRVMSLDYNGTGSLYQSTEDLQNLHNYLRAVKKLHSSS
jgi:hypothetical protein